MSELLSAGVSMAKNVDSIESAGIDERLQLLREIFDTDERRLGKYDPSNKDTIEYIEESDNFGFSWTRGHASLASSSSSSNSSNIIDDIHNDRNFINPTSLDLMCKSYDIEDARIARLLDPKYIFNDSSINFKNLQNHPKNFSNLRSNQNKYWSTVKYQQAKRLYAVHSHDAKKLATILTIAEEAMSLNESNFSALLLQSKILLSLNRRTDSLRILASLVDKAPNDSEIFVEGRQLLDQLTKKSDTISTASRTIMEMKPSITSTTQNGSKYSMEYGFQNIIDKLHDSIRDDSKEKEESESDEGSMSTNDDSSKKKKKRKKKHNKKHKKKLKKDELHK